MEPTKPRLIKRHHPLPHLEQPTIVYDRFNASIENIIAFGQKKALKALEEEQAKDPYPPPEELEEETEERIKFNAKQKLLRQINEELVELHRHWKKEHKRTLWGSPKWLTQSGVWDRLKKGRFKDVYSYLINECVPRPDKEDTKALIQRAGGTCWRGGKLPADGKDRQDAILKIDWERMSKELGITIGGSRKYFPAFVSAGILKPLPQKLPHGGIVYSIGEHRGYPTKEGGWGYKLFRYLKEDRTIIKGLGGMKLDR